MGKFVLTVNLSGDTLLTAVSAGPPDKKVYFFVRGSFLTFALLFLNLQAAKSAFLSRLSKLHQIIWFSFMKQKRSERGALVSRGKATAASLSEMPLTRYYQDLAHAFQPRIPKTCLVLLFQRWQKDHLFVTSEPASIHLA